MCLSLCEQERYTWLISHSYTYYPTGAVKSVSENGVTLTYTYDERGNVLTESDGTSVKSYTYNEFDGRASYTLKVNNVAIASETYAYDAARQLASVTTDSVKVTYGYDMNGNRITDRTINPTTGLEMSGHNYSFDGANRVTQVQGMMLVNNGASFIIPVNEVYAYNLDGSMLSKTDRNTSVATSYSYDGAGRLTYEIEGTAITTYAYDAANNRTSMYKDGVTTTYTYDANNRLLTEVKGSQTTRYTYDANGNQLSGNGLITYDARGRQSTWTDGLTTASYTYYPNDLRKSKTVGATTTNFVWDGQNMVYEYKGTNTTGGTAYYYGLTLISQGNYAYYLYNGHGDVVQLVTASNTLGRSYDYDAFGNEVNPSASDTNPFRYAGQYFDSETGTYYLRARYYDPGIGRFTQQDGWAFADPSDPLSLNLYTYCWNDPIKYIDSTGQSPEDVLAGAIIALDDGVAGGLAQWVVKKFKGQYASYQYDSDYDYCLGRVIGDLLSIFLGAGMTAKGLFDILASISGGAVITVGSGGIAIAGGAAISVGGVVAGSAEIAIGGTVMYFAASNLGDDWNDFQRAKTSIEDSKKNLKKLDDKYLKKNDIDPHEFKTDILKDLNVKDKTISHYNIYRDTYTNELYLVPNANKPAIATGVFLN